MSRSGLSRRLVIQAGAAALAGLLAPRSRAAAALVVPQIDSLNLQVIVDNATFGPFLPDLDLPGLKVLRANPDAGAATMTRTPLQGEFGLSIIAESLLGASRRQLIIDLGYSPEVLRNNLRVLGVDATQLDAAVLSHGHLDHYGGYAGLFAAGARPARNLPLYVGGEEAFCERLAMIGTPPPAMGALDRAALRTAGFEPRLAAEPALIAQHAFTTGLIPLQGAERAAIPTQMKPGVGCDVAALTPAKRSATLLADDAEHELATAYVVRGRGLVVISSCSHRGVLNSIRRAQEVSGVSKVHAVVGGFHLVRPRTDDEGRQTAAEMVRIDPNYIVPMHCTGEVFIAEASRLMPGKVVRPYVGTRFAFTAA